MLMVGREILEILTIPSAAVSLFSLFVEGRAPGIGPL